MEEWTEAKIDKVIAEMRAKLRDCHLFLSQKNAAYARFDRFETVSANPYSMHARTRDSRNDFYIVQFLRQSERALPYNAASIRSLHDLLARRREINNFWTDLWEAVRRAEARASLAERMAAMPSANSSAPASASPPQTHSPSASTSPPASPRPNPAHPRTDQDAPSRGLSQLVDAPRRTLPAPITGTPSVGPNEGNRP